MNRAGRLKSARATGWVRSYRGKDIVRGYARWYGVDRLCAVLELRQLGVHISAEQEARCRSQIEQRAARDARKDGEHGGPDESAHVPESDLTFAYIAGYTPGGAPYGVTWEEYRRLEEVQEGKAGEHTGRRARDDDHGRRDES